MARLPRQNGTPFATGPLSLIRNGTPARGPSGAWSSAGSNSGRASPLTSASACSRAARAAVSTSAAVTCPALIRSRSPIASWLAYSCGSTGHLHRERPAHGPPARSEAMLAARLPGVERFSAPLGALGEVVLVDADLVVDQVEALGETRDLGGHLGAVRTHDGEAFVLVAAAFPDEFGVPPDHRNGHPGGTQHDADGEPVDVVLAVEATAARGALDRVGEDPLTLVETQRVHAQPGALGHLADGQARCGGLGHAGQNTGSVSGASVAGEGLDGAYNAVGVGQGGEHDVRAGVAQVGLRGVAGGDRDRTGVADLGGPYVVRRVRDQYRGRLGDLGAVLLGRTGAGQLDQRRLRVGLRAVAADGEVDVSVQAEGGQLGDRVAFDRAGQHRLDDIAQPADRGEGVARPPQHPTVLAVRLAESGHTVGHVPCLFRLDEPAGP